MSAPVQLRAAHAWHGITADSLRIVTLAERPELGSAIPAVLASRWPIYMRSSAAIARSARTSWDTPMTVFSTTTRAMTAVSG